MLVLIAVRIQPILPLTLSGWSNAIPSLHTHSTHTRSRENTNIWHRLKMFERGTRRRKIVSAFSMLREPVSERQRDYIHSKEIMHLKSFPMGCTPRLIIIIFMHPCATASSCTQLMSRIKKKLFEKHMCTLHTAHVVADSKVSWNCRRWKGPSLLWKSFPFRKMFPVWFFLRRSVPCRLNRSMLMCAVLLLLKIITLFHSSSQWMSKLHVEFKS